MHNARKSLECSTHSYLKSTYSKIWTMRSEDLQYIANNLPNSFTEYKGVTQSYNPAKICLKEWRYQQKSLHSPFKATGGEAWQKYIRIQLLASKDIKAIESVNASQLHVDRHLMGSIHPVDGKPPPTQVIVHTMTGTSEYPTQPHWETASSHHG
jgi:hypothetical protein